jgi:hypothetical protein
LSTPQVCYWGKFGKHLLVLRFSQFDPNRRYHDLKPVTGEEYQLRDRMLRKACGSFVLLVAGESPGDPEVEEAYSLEQVFEWLRECPQQIERAVVRQ